MQGFGLGLMKNLSRPRSSASIPSRLMGRFPPKDELEAAQARTRAFEALVGQHLNAILEPRGFAQSLQGGAALDPVEGHFLPPYALYEARPAEYVRRYPALAEDIEVEHVPCIDLWLHLQPDGRIRCELEGRPLEWLLGEGGHAQELDAYTRAPIGEIPQLEAIAQGLRVVLDAATGTERQEKMR